MNSVYVNEMVAHRRHLHKRPEEGWTEFETTYYIVDQLRKMGIPVTVGKANINRKSVV